MEEKGGRVEEQKQFWKEIKNKAHSEFLNVVIPISLHLSQQLIISSDLSEEGKDRKLGKKQLES